jgi:Ala-tRNA(Pro) deacylase
MNDVIQHKTINAPISCEVLLSLLDDEAIEYQVTRHNPLMTVEDAKSIRSGADSDIGQIKNLFVHNKKKKMWLLTLHEDRQINLKQTAVQIGAGRFSFCNSERLMQYLGVIPGAVSPLALLNDTGCEVEFYIDEILMAHPVIHVHPLDNRVTVTIETGKMLNFLATHGHRYNILRV